MSRLGLQEITSAAIGRSGEENAIAVLDGNSSQVVAIDQGGQVLARRRLELLDDGSKPAFVGLDQGDLILGSGNTPSCARLSFPDLVLLSKCRLGPPLGRRTQYLTDSGRVVGVAGAFDEGTAYLGGTDARWIGSGRVISTPADSARMRWGVPFFTLRGSELGEVQLNPPQVRILSTDSRLIGRWAPKNKEQAEEFRAIMEGGEGFLFDLYSRTIGVAGFQQGILISVFRPDQDASTLNLISWTGRSIAETNLPLFFRPLFGHEDLLIADLRINGSKLALFRVGERL